MRAERKMMAFAGRGGFRPGLFLIIASAVLASAVPDWHAALAAEMKAPAGSVVVALDRAKIIKLPEKTATLVIGNPLIADAAVQPGGVAVITAKGYGATNLVAIDRHGVILLETPVQVVGPADKIVVMYRGIDRETYSCAPNCERRITIGDTPAYFTSNLQQIGTFGTLAQSGGLSGGAAGPR
jgi:Flp pilus assembly secretin CpaC